jgi:ABC-type sugar transport system ATPase subunit
MTTTTPLVQVVDVSRSFGGIQALSKVSIDLMPGEVHALCGANGAGKSTLKNVISGAITPDEGTVLVSGQPVDLKTPLDAMRLGIHAVHQELGLIPWMTVEDNLFLGRYPDRGGLIDRRAMRASAREALARAGVQVSPRARLGSLSVGQQQLVEIARATTSHPKVLLLDEPSAVLVGPELERVFSAVNRLREEGVAVVYVSHRLDEVFQLADRVTVMRNGQVVRTAPIGEFDHDSLIRAMTGRSVEKPVRQQPVAGGDVRLSVQNLHAGKGRLKDISLEVRRGEIFGIAGLMGSGRSHLLKCLYGVDHIDSGSVSLDGTPHRQGSPRESVGRGIVLVPEDRKSAGLIIDLAIQRNLTLPNLKAVAPRGWLNAGRSQALARKLAGLVGIAENRLPAPVSQLSGGNQQKVAVARWLDRDPAVLLIDEPTRGVDVGAKADIYHLLQELAGRGTSIVVVSSEFEELLALCHRLQVMRDGEVVGEVDPRSATPEDLLRMCTPSAKEAARG